MKPIAGTVISSKPISLAKAATVLSKFVSSDTCATPEISAYLARSSAAFDELVEYHSGLEARGEKEKGKGDSVGLAEEPDGVGRDANGAVKDGVLVDGEAQRWDFEGLKTKRKKKRREKVDALEEDGGKERTSGVYSQKKHKKKRRNGEEGESEHFDRKKKKKKRKHMEVEEAKGDRGEKRHKKRRLEGQ